VVNGRVRAIATTHLTLLYHALASLPGAGQERWPRSGGAAHSYKSRRRSPNMLPTSTQKRWGEVDERTIVELQARRAASKFSRDSCPGITRGMIHYAAGGPMASSCRHHRHLLGRDSVKIQIGLPRVGNGSTTAVACLGESVSLAPVSRPSATSNQSSLQCHKQTVGHPAWAYS
jgi:hypothetical protein